MPEKIAILKVKSPCEICSHKDICKYVESIDTIISTIENSVSDIPNSECLNDIRISCKYNQYISHKEFLNDINENSRSSGVYETAGPSTMNVRYPQNIPNTNGDMYNLKQNITQGLQEYIGDDTSAEEFSTKASDGTPRTIRVTSHKIKSETEPDVKKMVIDPNVPVEGINPDDLPPELRGKIL